MNGIQQITTALLLGLIAFGALLIILSAIFDIRRAGAQSDLAKHPFRRRFRRRPCVVLIIEPAKPAELYDCLKSIADNRYRNYTVYIIGRRRDKDLRAALSRFSLNYPKARVVLSTLRESQLALKSPDVELVLKINSSQRLGANFLKQSVLEFAVLPKSQILHPAPATQASYTLHNLIQRVSESALLPPRKALSLLGKANWINNLSVNKTQARGNAGKRKGSSAFSAAAVIYQTPHSGLSGWFRTLFVPGFTSVKAKYSAFRVAGLAFMFAILAGFLALGGYGAYLALWHINSYLLVILWCGFIAYLFLALLATDYLRLLAKLKLLVCLPIMPGLLYVWLAVRLLADLTRVVLAIIHFVSKHLSLIFGYSLRRQKPVATS